MKKFVASTLGEFLNERDEEPVALAVLGAPAGGKSFTMGKIKDVVDDAGVLRTLDKGRELTVDKLRDEFLSKDSKQQLYGFVRAFYLMKEKYKEDPKEFGKWYKDIINLWTGKFSELMPELKISYENETLYFQGRPAYQAIGLINQMDTKKVIDKLDDYHDYKRVVRYFQNIKQREAINKKMDVSYDEAGDEPTKILKNLKDLDNQDYVTDVFLIHPKNIASNLIQNWFRVTIGGDGGRDSSQAIIGAYNDIEQNKDLYKKNSEETMKAKSTELSKVAKPLKDATSDDDHERGNKPIDVFVEVQPMSPPQAYKTFMEKITPDQQKIFNALLIYSINDLKNVPQEAKDSILELTKKYSKEDALKIIRKASENGNYVFKFGGVTPKLAKRAEEILQ